ncbi:Y+L amino acid transporter 2-like [Scylla paramamosain]|uniref:Y+L amino acid transporter 2-like n=1 Tax=Scylla paramamosain TaxID=85552 RepID=UPI003082BC8A
MIPQSGGNYTYLHEAYGPMPAFILIWMTVTIAIPGSRAVAALTFANYVVQPFFPNEQTPPQSALRIIGILLILLLTYINARRVRWATKVQDILALTKVLALIMIIMVGFFHLFRGTTDNFKDPMEGTSTSPTMVATAFYHTLYAYEGWDSLNSIMEELKDPFRNMPRAIAISVTIVIIIYMLTNVAYFAVLPKDLLLSSPAVAVTFGNLALGMMAWTIPIFVACSISGGLNGSTFATSRLLFVGSRRGHLPRALSFVHVDNNTPVISLFFSAVLSMLMFVTSDVRVLINYLSFSGNLLALLCLSTFFWFRVKQPNLARPIKVWIGFPIIFSILSFFLCVMPVIRNPLEVAAALAVIVTGLPVYYFLVRNEVKPQRLVTAMDKVTYVCQLFFKAVPEERAS